MRATGFLLLIAGWMLVDLALILLPGGAARAAFLAAGLAVQVLGLALAVRSQLLPRKERS